MVPNSDTSGTAASQSLSQSQPQSQLQVYSHYDSQPNNSSRVLPEIPENGTVSVEGDSADKWASSQQPSFHPIELSQAAGYDADRSSPDISQVGQTGLPPEDAQASNSAKGGGSAEHSEESQGQEEDEDGDENVDQLQSDDEHLAEGEETNQQLPMPIVKQPQPRELSPDDAQINKMLTKSVLQTVDSQSVEEPSESSRIHRLSTAKDRIPSAAVSVPFTLLTYSRKQTPVTAPGPSCPSPSPAANPPSRDTTDIQNGSSGNTSKRDRSSSKQPTMEREHDAEAWKEPTFMRSVWKGKEKAAPAKGDVENGKHGRAKSGLRVLHPTAHQAKPSTNSSTDKPDVAVIVEPSLKVGRAHVVTASVRPNHRDHPPEGEGELSWLDLEQKNSGKMNVGQDKSGSRTTSSGSAELLTDRVRSDRAQIAVSSSKTPTAQERPAIAKPPSSYIIPRLMSVAPARSNKRERDPSPEEGSSQPSKDIDLKQRKKRKVEVDRIKDQERNSGSRNETSSGLGVLSKGSMVGQLVIGATRTLRLFSFC